MLVLWGLITHGTFAGTGDEPHYLAVAHSVAFDGDLDLSNNYGRNEPLISGGALEPGPHVRVGRAGVTRPIHDVGMPILFAPVVRVAVPLVHTLVRAVPASTLQRARLTPSVLYRHVLSFAMILIAVVLARLLFDTFVTIGATPRGALGATLLVMLSPPLLVFSVLFFTELLGALLCVFVFRRIVIAEAGRPAAAALAGAAAGLLFLVHARNIGLTIALAIVALITWHRPADRRTLTAFTAGLAALLALRTALNYHFWGTFVTTPHAALGDASPSAVLREAGIRAAGLLVDQEFGLLIYAPVYALAILGLGRMWFVHRPLTGKLLLVGGAYLGLILLMWTNPHGWTGGWSPAARFVTPIVPLLAIALLVGLRTVPAVVVVPLVVLQIAINAFVWQDPKLLWNDGDGRARFCTVLGDKWCGRLPSLGPQGNPPSRATVPRD